MGSGFSIKLINRHKKYKINESLLKKIIKEILGLCEGLKNIELEIVFLDDRSIRRLNKRFKKKDEPTDVLSFGMKAEEFGCRPFIGEIFISLDRALENSETFGSSFAEEALLYVIHGILHIIGYDDENSAARRRMSKKERDILRYLWKREDLSKVLTRR